MSRVLARNLFKKKAPKRSAKGVGITSMFEDDVPGYAEGGEVETDDRTERERAARMLLEKNKDEMELYQRFSEGERPQMTRLPATVGVVQQPNPQQMQAMQMQRMAQMGMIPRFQEGGIVQRQPLYGWGSRIRGWSEPDPRLGSPASDNPNFLFREPAVPMYRNPMTADISETPQPRQFPPEGTMTSPDSIGGVRPVMIPSRDESRIIRAEETVSPGEPDRETSRARGLSDLPYTSKGEEAPKKKQDRLLPPGEKKQESDKKTDLSDIKADRRENMWLSLMQAGLAIMGGKSSNALTNIGQGGQAGLASFITLEQQRRRDEDAAVRRDLAQREYNLQARRLDAQEPLIAAQAEYYRMRPQIEAEKRAWEQKKLVAMAQDRAESEVSKEVAKNPIPYMGKNGQIDRMKVDLEVQRRLQSIVTRAQIGGYGGYGGGNTNRLGLELPSTEDGE